MKAIVIAVLMAGHAGIQGAYSTPELCMQAMDWWKNRHPDTNWSCVEVTVRDSLEDYYSESPKGPPR